MIGFSNEILTTRPLVKSAVANGRWVTVTTYVEGGVTPVVGHLLFETAQDAQSFAQYVSCGQIAVPVQKEGT